MLKHIIKHGTWPALAWCEWSFAVHSSHHMAYCSCKRRTSSWSFIRNRRASRGKRPLGVWKAMPVNDWALWLLRKVHSSRHTNHFVAFPFESQDASWLLGREREPVQKHRHDMFKEPHVFWRTNRTSSLVGPCPCNAVEQTNWFTMVYLYKDTPNDQSTKGACVPTTTLQWNAMSSLIGPIR